MRGLALATDRKRRGPFEPLFDIHPQSGATFEVFYADRTLETFGRGGSGWFWWTRRRGFAPDGAARGPFPTSYSAFHDALQRRTDPHNSGERLPGFRLDADRAGACMRQGAAEQIASEAARAAARAEPNSVQNLLKYQLPVSTIGGEGGILSSSPGDLENGSENSVFRTT
jgi:hypothetical protein